MKDLIRAQLYQIRRKRVLWIALVGVILLDILMFVIISNDDGYEITSASQAVANGSISGFTVILSVILGSVFAGFICADDFTDKTVNYELMSGTLRIRLYISRVLMAAVFSLCVMLLIITLPTAVLTLTLGFGEAVSVSAVVVRTLLLIFPLFRLCCFFVMAAFLFKKPIAVLIVTFAVMQIIGIISANGAASGADIFAFGTISKLMHFESWYTFALDGAEHFVYESALPAGTALTSAAVSLAFGAVYLLMGYYYFKKDDLN